MKTASIKLIGMPVIHWAGGRLPSTGLTLGYMALLLILSTIPDTEATENPWRLLLLVPPNVQNLAHIPAYGLLAFLFMVNLRFLAVSRLQAVIAAMILTSTYGVLVELLQMVIPGRLPSIVDCLFNVAGILICTTCYLMVTCQGSTAWWRSVSARVKLQGDT